MRKKDSTRKIIDELSEKGCYGRYFVLAVKDHRTADPAKAKYYTVYKQAMAKENEWIADCTTKEIAALVAGYSVANDEDASMQETVPEHVIVIPDISTNETENDNGQSNMANNQRQH